MEIMRIGLDLAKNVFEVFGVDQKEQPVLRKTLKRSQVIDFFARIGPCTVAFEASRTPPSSVPPRKTPPALISLVAVERRICSSAAIGSRAANSVHHG